VYSFLACLFLFMGVGWVPHEFLVSFFLFLMIFSCDGK